MKRVNEMVHSVYGKIYIVVISRRLRVERMGDYKEISWVEAGIQKEDRNDEKL